MVTIRQGDKRQNEKIISYIMNNVLSLSKALIVLFNATLSLVSFVILILIIGFSKILISFTFIIFV